MLHAAYNIFVNAHIIEQENRARPHNSARFSYGPGAQLFPGPKSTFLRVLSRDGGEDRVGERGGIPLTIVVLTYVYLCCCLWLLFVLILCSLTVHLESQCIFDPAANQDQPTI